VNSLTATKKLSFTNIDRWDLDQFIEVTATLGLLKPTHPARRDWPKTSEI
jgi:hypothetical protein